MAALEELLPLVDDSKPASAPEAIELAIMSDFVIAYEKEHYPIGRAHTSHCQSPLRRPWHLPRPDAGDVAQSSHTLEYEQQALADGADTIGNALLHCGAGMAKTVGIMAQLLLSNAGFAGKGLSGNISVCIL